jgi:hypothetical protein
MRSPAQYLIVAERKREAAIHGCSNRQGIIAARMGRVRKTAPIFAAMMKCNA